jgi:hypothetical protein
VNVVVIADPYCCPGSTGLYYRDADE